MAGERDLDALLAGLDPVLHPEELVWCTVPAGEPVPDVATFARIQEDDGTTLVVPPEAAARLGLAHEVPSRRIELRVHSDLAAVGLTAAVAGALAAEGISANVVAAFHHDHVLVPAADATRALQVLHALADAASADPAPFVAVLDGEAAIGLRAPAPDETWPMFDVRLEVRGLGITADIRSEWDVEQVEELAAALEAVAGGSLDDQLVDGGRGPTVWFRSRGRVDGLWEVEVTAGGVRDSTAMAATTLERTACAAAAARARTLLGAGDQTS